jgi:hypothetical protein
MNNASVLDVFERGDDGNEGIYWSHAFLSRELAQNMKIINFTTQITN